MILPVTPARLRASYIQRTPDFPPAPIITTVSPGLTIRAVWAGAPATSKTAKAIFSGISAGNLA